MPMNPPPAVHYEMLVAAHLYWDGHDLSGVYGTGPDPNDKLQWLWDRIGETLEGEAAGWHDQLAAADLADEDGTFVPPVFLLDKLTEVSQQIRHLEAYRAALVTFARTFAVDPESTREIAARTELSHTTVARLTDEPNRYKVAFAAKKMAAKVLADLTPQADPDLYARLRGILAQLKDIPTDPVFDHTEPDDLDNPFRAAPQPADSPARASSQVGDDARNGSEVGADGPVR